MNPKQNPVVLVGGNQRGLEILSLLIEDRCYDSALIIEPDRGALVYHLRDFGFSFSDSFKIELSQKLSDLKTRAGLRQIVDASGNPRIHRDLYQLGTQAEISKDSVFQLLYSLKKTQEMGSQVKALRQSHLIENIEKPLHEIDFASDEDEFFRFLLDSTLLATQAEGAELFLMEEDEKYLTLAMAREQGMTPKWHPPEILLKGGRGVVSYVARTRHPIILPKDESSVWEQEVLEGEEISTLLALPILENNKLLGVLFLYRVTDSTPFTKQDLAFLSKLLVFLIKPITKILSLKDIRETSLAEALRKEVQKIINTKLDIQPKLQKSLEKITKGLFSLQGNLYVKESHSDDLILQGTTHYSPQMLGLIRSKKGKGVIGKTAQVNHPFYLKQDPLSVLPPLQEIGANPATLSLPLSAKSELVGVMHLEFDHLPRLPEKTLKLGMDLCELLATAIASDTEHKRMSQKILKLTVVNEEGLELLSITDREKIYRFSTASAAMVTEAEAVILRINDIGGKGLRVASTYGLHQDEIGQQLVELDQTIGSKVFETEKTLLISDFKDSEFSCPETFPYHSALSVVLLGDDKPIGTLTVYNKLLYNSFSCTSFHKDDEEILVKYANYVAKSLLQAQEFKSRQALVTIDALTGLRNKRYLQLRLPEEIQRAERYQRNLTLIMMEIDNQQESYKELPQTEKQDLVKRIADIVRETFRNVDIIVRMEREKFVILMPDTVDKGSEAVARISRSVSGIKIKSLRSGTVSPLMIRIGQGNFPDDASEPEDLLAVASQMKPAN